MEVEGFCVWFYSEKVRLGPSHPTLCERVACFRCKLFYKKESEFKEKGVGTLHLKLTEQGKTQMIVRADTNLGNKKINSLQLKKS